MDPIRHRREGGLPWEWLGEYPLCLKLCRVWEPSQVQATESSNVTYIIRISYDVMVVMNWMILIIV